MSTLRQENYVNLLLRFKNLNFSDFSLIDCRLYGTAASAGGIQVAIANFHGAPSLPNRPAFTSRTRFVTRSSKATRVFNVEVRRALLSEANILSDLAFRSKGYWPYDAVALFNYRSQLLLSVQDISEESTYVGIVENEIVGFYTLSSAPGLQRLYFLFVEPEFIGLGYGRKLWDHALLTAKSNRWKSISLFADQFAIDKFYGKFAGKKIGEMQTELCALIELQFGIV